MKSLWRIADEQRLILDGAMGTELERRGIPLPSPLWSIAALITHPEVVYQIHCEYLKAGANLHTTCTFHAFEATFQKPESQKLLQELGAKDFTYRDAVRTAVQILRKAIQDTAPAQPVFILGGVGTIEDCLRPDAAPAMEICAEEHKKTIEAFRDEQVDGILFETIGTFSEFWGALYRVNQYLIPFILSVVLKDSEHLLSGEPLEKAYRALIGFPALAFSINCTPPEVIAEAFQKLCALSPPLLNLAAYPNCGFYLDKRSPCDIPPQTFADILFMLFKPRRLPCEEKLRIIGGCCGTTPDHIAELAKRLPKEF